MSVLNGINRPFSENEKSLIRNGGSATRFVGVERKEYSKKGIMYEKTPILQELPQIGDMIQLSEKEVYTYGKEQYVPCEQGKIFEVRNYSRGIDLPLANNNYMLCSYKAPSGLTLTKSFRVLDITLGILHITKLNNEKEEAGNEEIYCEQFAMG